MQNLRGRRMQRPWTGASTYLLLVACPDCFLIPYVIIHTGVTSLLWNKAPHTNYQSRKYTTGQTGRSIFTNEVLSSKKVLCILCQIDIKAYPVQLFNKDRKVIIKVRARKKAQMYQYHVIISVSAKIATNDFCLKKQASFIHRYKHKISKQNNRRPSKEVY